jgi:hypothetical protein
MEAANAAAKRAADATERAVKNANATASKTIDDVTGAAKGLTSRLDGATRDVGKQAKSIVSDATGGSSSGLDANTQNVITAVVAGVLIVGAGYYLYQEYKKKEGKTA